MTFLDTDILQAILNHQSYPPWYLEFMLIHDRLGHLPFVKFLNRWIVGVCPRNFLSCKVNNRLSFVCFCKGKAQGLAWLW